MRVRKVATPEIDDRTDEMTNNALTCRSFGHRWVMHPTDRTRFLGLLEAGYKEIVVTCANGCGLSLTTVYNRSTGEVVQQVRRYADSSYFVPKGTGRMHRSDARVALWVREDKDFYRRTRTPRTPVSR